MKTFTAVFSLFIVTGAAFAQGTVGMANSAASLVKQVTSLSDYTLINVPAGQGKVEFLWAPDGTTDTTLFQVVSGATPYTINPTPGRFSSPIAITIPAGSGFTGIAPGAIISAMIRGWTGTAPDYASAIAAGASFVGYSSIFRVDTGDPTAVPAGTPGNIVSSISGQGFPGLPLTPFGDPVPEPTTAAL